MITIFLELLEMILAQADLISVQPTMEQNIMFAFRAGEQRVVSPVRRCWFSR